MTVCVAAFAAKEEAIVLIADKAVALGQMVSDTTICKMSRIKDTRWYALISGDISIADAMLLQCEAELAKAPSDADMLLSMMKLTSRVYSEIYESELEAEVLKPKLLTKTDVFQRPRRLLPLSQKLDDEITEDRKQFVREWSCEILICGFDSKDQPHLFRVVHPGRARGEDRMGFSAVGIGADAAIGRLMFIDSDRDDDLAKILWDTFDAKVQAELMQNVGYDWDAHIVLKSTPKHAVQVPEKLQELMDTAWRYSSGTSQFDSEPWKPDDIPPDDWKDQIKQFAESLIPNTQPV